MWPHALVGAARANVENCRRVFSALTELTREIGDGIVVADLITRSLIATARAS